jgi:hypothetical protein
MPSSVVPTKAVKAYGQVSPARSEPLQNLGQPRVLWRACLSSAPLVVRMRADAPEKPCFTYKTAQSSLIPERAFGKAADALVATAQRTVRDRHPLAHQVDAWLALDKGGGWIRPYRHAPFPFAGSPAGLVAARYQQGILFCKGRGRVVNC